MVPLLLERVELPLERATLPLDRVVALPEEVVEDPLLLFRRRLLSCWTVPLERVALPELERLLERETELLEEERVELPEEPTELPLERRLPEELPEEEEPLCWVVVLPPPERRDWARISGAMSMARASIRDAVNVINLLIAQRVFKLKFINSGKAV